MYRICNPENVAHIHMGEPTNTIRPVAKSSPFHGEEAGAEPASCTK